MHRQTFVLLVMIVGTAIGFIGIYVLVLGIANDDLNLIVLSMFMISGMIVPRVLGDSKSVDKWSNK